MKKNLCVVCADSGILDRLDAIIASAHFDGNWDGDFLVISNNSDPKVKKMFNDKGIYYLYVNDGLIYFSDIFNSDGLKETVWPVAILYRYLLFYLDFFKKWEKILYLDADMLVFDKIDFMDREGDFFAVRDYCPIGDYLLYTVKTAEDKEGKKRRAKFYSNLQKDFDISPKTATFNSGLFVFNPKIMTQEKRDEFTNINKKYLSEASFPDQLTLNLLFRDEIKFLPRCYNCSYEYSSDGDLTKIFHSISEPKIWDEGHYLCGVWWDYKRAFNSMYLDPISEEDLSSFDSETEVEIRQVFGDEARSIGSALKREDIGFFELFKKKGVGMEIGAGTGTFTKVIYDRVRPETMYIIDPWEKQYETGYELDGANNGDHEFSMRTFFGSFSSKIYDGSMKVIRNYDISCLDSFPDNYLDWVYIDANNNYEHMKKVLSLLDKKVKKAGVISGHDLVYCVDMKFGTVPAVRWFCEEKGWEPALITEEKWKSYILRRKTC